MIIIAVILTIAYTITVFTIVHQQDKEFSNFQKELFKSEMNIKRSEAHLLKEKHLQLKKTKML